MGPLFPGLGNGQPIGLGLSLTPTIAAAALLSLRGGPRADARRYAPLVLAAPSWVVLCLSSPWQVRCLFAPPPKGSVGLWSWCHQLLGAGWRSRSARSALGACCVSSGRSGISRLPAGIGAGLPWLYPKQLRSIWSSSWLSSIAKAPLGVGSSSLNPGHGLCRPFGAGRPIWQKRLAAGAGPCRPSSSRSSSPHPGPCQLGPCS